MPKLKPLDLESAILLTTVGHFHAFMSAILNPLRAAILIVDERSSTCIIPLPFSYNLRQYYLYIFLCLYVI